jgi:hypothetical protein
MAGIGSEDCASISVPHPDRKTISLSIRAVFVHELEIAQASTRKRLALLLAPLTIASGLLFENRNPSRNYA